MSDVHLARARKSLKDRDELRSFLQLFLTIIFPLLIAIASGLISFSSDQAVKDGSMSTIVICAVMSIVFGFFLHRISSKEFYSLVFDYDDIKSEKEELEYLTLDAMRDSLRYKAIADTLDIAQMELTPYIQNRSSLSISNAKTLLTTVLSPIESTLSELFMIDMNTSFNFSVYLLDNNNQLHCSYRARNFKESTESRVWYLTDTHSHIVSTFNLRKSCASSNIWNTDVLSSDEMQNNDRKYYSSFICSPILSSGSEDDPSSSTAIGVVCITSSIINHFGPDNDAERGIFHQTARIKMRIIASCLSSLFTPFTGITVD